jgi:tubulin-specific chaperone C
VFDTSTFNSARSSRIADLLLSDPTSLLVFKRLHSAIMASFSSSKLSIEQSLSGCRSHADLDQIAASISSLDELLAHNSYHLPSYELRSCLKSIADLRFAYESTSTSLAPKKKFSFRNIALKKDEEPKKVETPLEISITPSEK